MGTDYARVEHFEEEQFTAKQLKKLKTNQVYESKCKTGGTERVYFNHKDPRYIREHLYGIYHYGYEHGFIVNVKKYCEQAFPGDEGNQTKYRRLSPHFTRSKLLVELKKKVHYDSIVIQDLIDTYLNELIAKKEVYEVMGSEEENTTNEGGETTTSNNTMVDDVN